jgi:hypothetical protein
VNTMCLTKFRVPLKARAVLRNSEKGLSFVHLFSFSIFQFISVPFQPIIFLGFEVLMTRVMKIPVFWDITPCSALEVNRLFEGTCRLHFQS